MGRPQTSPPRDSSAAKAPVPVTARASAALPRAAEPSGRFRVQSAEARPRSLSLRRRRPDARRSSHVIEEPRGLC